MSHAYRRMVPDARVYVAGHNGLVGSALIRRLQKGGYSDLITAERGQVDLRRPDQVEALLTDTRPEFAIIAAARVGGILANNEQPAEFISDNLLIQTNLINAAYAAGVQRLMFLGSSCIYPRLCPQPMQEEHLLTGPLEPTNKPYAVAKIAGITMCDAYNRQYGTRYLSVMPTNLYGPGDNFDLRTSHVLPALLRKFHEAKASGASTVTLWGTGSPRREFLHVDDLADAIVYLLEHTDTTELVNIGLGTDISIAELAALISEVVGFEGDIAHDLSKPDGTPRKLLDVGRLHGLGWRHHYELRAGIEHTYAWYLEQLEPS